ncbi:LytR family transcriptional regulator, partial [Streptomyces pilosus]
MDAPSRGQADGTDPADQWVLNPATGDYELRLNGAPGRPAVPRPRGASRPRPASPASAPSSAPARVPGQRGHRAAPAPAPDADGPQ